jgi:hypothetical protein
MNNKRVRPPYKWFIEPGDSNTNEAIAREVSSEDAMEIHDDKGTRRRVYLITSKKLTQFRNSKAAAGFRFRILVQEGEGKIRDVSFLPSPGKRRAADFSRKALAAIATK